MENKEKYHTCAETAVRPSVMRGRVPTFRESVERVKRQIGYGELSTWMGKQRELDLIVRVMADVYCKAPGVLMVIDGEVTSAEVVQEVFSELTHGEAEALMLRLEADALCNPKGYIRTAVYNAAIEGNRRE